MPLIGKSRLKKGLDVNVTLQCADPITTFGAAWGTLWEGRHAEVHGSTFLYDCRGHADMGAEGA